MAQQRRKRVSKKVYRQRQMALIAAMSLLAVLLLVLLVQSLSSRKKEQRPQSMSSVGTNTGQAASTTVQTQTTAGVTTAATTTTITAAATEPGEIVAEGITLSVNEVSLKVGASKMPIVTMLPPEAKNKDEIWQSSDPSVATVNALGNITGVAPGTCLITVTAAANPAVSATVTVTVTETGEVSSAEATEPTYIDGILIVNKSYGLPASYAPGEDPTARAAFDQMQAAAAAAGLNIFISSGYRSYDYQNQIYNNYSNAYGAATADTFSARPGHSEHQTGLAFDLNSVDDSFADTAESDWVKAHAHEYGFIIRYPEGKEAITGYKYEPWHLRYLGTDKATAVYNSGKTLEEYLGIRSQYSE